jgi:triphosphoribosyl-dephospho-CoA synthase
MDMDFPMFVASAMALRPCFSACAQAGMEPASAFSGKLETLRPIGLAGEAAMRQATGGVNTHKGAIFCLGLLSAGLASVQRDTTTRYVGEAACEWVSDCCAGLVARELAKPGARPSATAGEWLYSERGVRGARGQAEDGYPLLSRLMLPLLRRNLAQDLMRFSYACLDALLLSMRELEDSCLLARGGSKGLALVQEGADEVLNLGGSSSVKGRPALRALDKRLCEARLSPGGSADLLAAGIFLARAERILAARQLERFIA